MTCTKCKTPKKLPVNITMAFQPIVNLDSFTVHGYEALVRQTDGQGAASVFDAVPYEDLYWLDQSCRVKAIELAAKLNLQGFLSINFMPNAVYEPSRCIKTTLNTAKAVGFPTDRIIFEFTEDESVLNPDHVINIINDYRSRGFQTAIDDFGAGYSGIKLLCDVHTDAVKMDRALIKGIDKDARRLGIVTDTRALLNSVTNYIVVEGVETAEELKVLYNLGFRYFQGFYLAKPGFEHLPEVDFDAIKALLLPTEASAVSSA
ncbi:EAL domain-containing protein [Glaciecola siphonariae]|uniref:EAL domain-containing protein n=1 Tax=Glaciecola siphonariae TaxID=521012 RepID=A0ABV9LVB7_9ALTE